MRSHPSPPFLLPPPESVRADAWRLEDGAELGERMDHWDPFTDIQVSRSVTVDLDWVRESCQLDADSVFAVVASWRSDRTRLTSACEPVSLGSHAGAVRAPVLLDVRGSEAGGRLDLRTQLVVVTPGADASPISPQRPAAVLWSDSVTVMLEGGAARFPVAAVDFEVLNRFPNDASWALEWNPEDLDAPVLGAIRLLINNTDEPLVGALRSGSQDPRSGMARAFVTYDVARALVHGALRNDRFLDNPEGFEEGSVGRMLHELISACWTIPLPALRARLVDDPARVDAELQDHLGGVL